LHEALENCNRYIEQFGGHSMAIGITIQKDNFQKFKDDIEEYAKSKNISEIVPEIQVDEKIQLQDISIKDVEELSLLEPFGEGNRVPLFQISGLKISSIRALSEGKHLKLFLKDDNKYIDAIGFNMGNIADKYTIEDKIDIIGGLELNSYNGTEKMQINLKDIRHSI
jgi:single-stranded-DNA-specific exonuclease